MIGNARRWKVKTRSARKVVLRSAPVWPYLGVRTNSLGLRRIADQIASSTAFVLSRLTPTPRPIRNGRYRSDFQPALSPNNSRCPNTKNVLAEHVARMKRLAEKT